MSLQKKIVVLFLALGAVFALGSYAGLRAFVLPTFQAFEQESARENLDRVRRALDADLYSLQVVNREYSEWDHTHDFVLGRREYYTDENLDIAYWTNININGMAFFDLQGEMLWGKLVDQSITNELPLQSELLQPLDPGHPLLRHTSTTSSYLGILQARTAPLLVSSQPILKSTGEGPVAGTLIIMRFLDTDLVSELGQRVGVKSDLYSIDDGRVTASLAAKIESGRDAIDDVTWTKTDDLVTGYLVIKDVFGDPAYVLEVNAPRTISSIGENTIGTALLFFLAATMLFLLVGWIFTRRLIVSPLSLLTTHIFNIRATGDLEQPLDTTRADEIGELQKEFSNLAHRLADAQRELEAARDQALAVSNAKSDFLAKMSHEIRTPMNGVLGMIELLANTPLDRVQKSYMHSIRESSDTLLHIISDILDFSKIEAGKLSLEPRTFKLNPFLADVTDSLSALAQKKGLRLNHIVPDGAGAIVEADPVRLRQVLTNLLGNAIKFTEKGGVLLKVSSAPDDSEHGAFTFEVVDTGIGISSRKQQQIFESFTQEDGSTTRRYGGTGLGLTISKQLVEMMGGQIRLQSAPGEGSNFSFMLRLRIGKPADLSSTQATLSHVYGELDTAGQALSPLCGRVLVVEDNAVNQAVAVGMLEAMGVESDVAVDGREAVDKWAEGRFDAVLMDCQMPILDGFEAARQIRRIESGSGRDPITIIAVTANALAGDMEKCNDAGMDDYLRKPYKGEQLHAVLAKVLQPGEETRRVKDVRLTSDHLGEFAAEIDGESLDANVLNSLSALPQAGDQDLVNQVVKTYINSSLDLMTRLGEAIDRHDAEYIRAAAHSLKSSSANVGATRLSELCASIETSTRSTDRASAATLQRQIHDEYQRVIEALKRRIASAA